MQIRTLFGVSELRRIANNKSQLRASINSHRIVKDSSVFSKTKKERAELKEMKLAYRKRKELEASI